MSVLSITCVYNRTINKSVKLAGNPHSECLIISGLIAFIFATVSKIVSPFYFRRSSNIQRYNLCSQSFCSYFKRTSSSVEFSKKSVTTILPFKISARFFPKILFASSNNLKISSLKKSEVVIKCLYFSFNFSSLIVPKSCLK